MDNFMGDFTGIIAILSSVALPIALGMYIAIRSIKNKHDERMELIKQGIAPPEDAKSIPNKYKTLRNGILILGVALGLVIGLLVGKNLNLNEDNMFWSVAPSILLFLGLSYILFYFVVKNKDLDEG